MIHDFIMNMLWAIGFAFVVIVFTSLIVFIAVNVYVFVAEKAMIKKMITKSPTPSVQRVPNCVGTWVGKTKDGYLSILRVQNPKAHCFHEYYDAWYGPLPLIDEFRNQLSSNVGDEK